MKLVENMAANRLSLSLWESVRANATKVRKSFDSALGAAVRERIFKNTPVVNNKILFITYSSEYDCNPKYITEKIIERNLPYDLVWVRGKGEDVDLSPFPNKVRLVQRGSYEFFAELASAHIWIDNALGCEWTRFTKKEGKQVYIDTWHGSMGLKKIDKGAGRSGKWMAAAKRVTKYVDYMVSDSEFENMVYRTTFWPDTKILEYGHPRNDILAINDAERNQKLRHKIGMQFGFDPSDKLFIFAPTFRDSGANVGNDIDFFTVIEALEKRFGGTWRVLTRAHVHDHKKQGMHGRSTGGRVIDVTSYLDMQELLAIADAGLTDYSSWCCDYILTGRPCFIYAPDYEAYKKGRGLYYPLEDTPFPLAFDRATIVKNILEFDGDAYARKRAEFLEARGCFEDGHAADRVVDKITEIIDAGAAK